jgi:branched-chain amino acid transport system permease protein
MIIERTMLPVAVQARSSLRPAAHFGLALIIEGVVRNYFGSSACPIRCRTALRGGQKSRLHVLPNYRAWVMSRRSTVCLGTWFVIERTRLGAYLRAATENPTLVRAFGINVPRMITLTYGFGVGCGARRRDGGADLQRLTADGLGPDHRGVCRGGDRRDGLDHGERSSPASGLGIIEGLTKCFSPKRPTP